MAGSVWLFYRAVPQIKGPPEMRFVAEYFAHAVEQRTRSFGNYRDAINFAERKATKRGSIHNEVPPDKRIR